MLDARRLAVLRAVARHGSFSAAAEALAFTQPAISKQIAALEAQAGTALVERTPRGVRLTQAGELLVTHADAIADRLAAAEAQLAALADLELGRVRLGAFPTAIATVVSEAIADFRGSHPGVALSLVQGLSPELIGQLRSGELDVAVVIDPGEEATEDDEIVLEHLADDPMHVALPRDHPLAERAAVSMDELACETWIEGREPDCARPLTACCAQAGFEPRIAFEAVDWIGKQGLVAAGVGVSLVPALSIAMLRPDIVVRPIEPVAHVRRVCAATLRCAHRPPAVPAMLDALRVAAHEHAGRLPGLVAA